MCSEKSTTDNETEWPPCLDRIRQYHEVRHDARQIKRWVGEIEEDLNTMVWMAAGGMGLPSRESVVESIDAQIKNLQTLRDQVEELDDPREMGRDVREKNRENRQTGSGE